MRNKKKLRKGYTEFTLVYINKGAKLAQRVGIVFWLAHQTQAAYP